MGRIRVCGSRGMASGTIQCKGCHWNIEHSQCIVSFRTKDSDLPGWDSVEVLFVASALSLKEIKREEIAASSFSVLKILRANPARNGKL